MLIYSVFQIITRHFNCLSFRKAIIIISSLIGCTHLFFNLNVTNYIPTCVALITIRSESRILFSYSNWLLLNRSSDGPLHTVVYYIRALDLDCGQQVVRQTLLHLRKNSSFNCTMCNERNHKHYLQGTVLTFFGEQLRDNNLVVPLNAVLVIRSVEED